LLRGSRGRTDRDRPVNPLLGRGCCNASRPALRLSRDGLPCAIEHLRRVQRRAPERRRPSGGGTGAARRSQAGTAPESGKQLWIDPAIRGQDRIASTEAARGPSAAAPSTPPWSRLLNASRPALRLSRDRLPCAIEHLRRVQRGAPELRRPRGGGPWRRRRSQGRAAAESGKQSWMDPRIGGQDRIASRKRRADGARPRVQPPPRSGLSNVRADPPQSPCRRESALGDPHRQSSSVR